MARAIEVISTWGPQYFEDYSTSALHFYDAIRTSLRQREIPDITCRNVNFNEGGALSGKRVYLEVTRGRFSFYICAAPFGKSYFFSWRLTGPGPAFGLLLLFALLC